MCKIEELKQSCEEETKEPVEFCPSTPIVPQATQFLDDLMRFDNGDYIYITDGDKTIKIKKTIPSRIFLLNLGSLYISGE